MVIAEVGDLLAKLPPPLPAAGPSIPNAWNKGARSPSRTLQLLPPGELFRGAQCAAPRRPARGLSREGHAGVQGQLARGYDASMADVLYQVSDEQILDLATFCPRSLKHAKSRPSAIIEPPSRQKMKSILNRHDAGRNYNDLQYVL